MISRWLPTLFPTSRPNYTNGKNRKLVSANLTARETSYRLYSQVPRALCFCATDLPCLSRGHATTTPPSRHLQSCRERYAALGRQSARLMMACPRARGRRCGSIQGRLNSDVMRRLALPISVALRPPPKSSAWSPSSRSEVVRRGKEKETGNPTSLNQARKKEEAVGLSDSPGVDSTMMDAHDPTLPPIIRLAIDAKEELWELWELLSVDATP